MRYAHEGFEVDAAQWTGEPGDTAVTDLVGEIWDYCDEKGLISGVRRRDEVPEVQVFLPEHDEYRWAVISPGQWVIADGGGDFLLVDDVVQVAENGRFCIAHKLDCDQEGNHYHCHPCGGLSGSQGHWVGGALGTVICDPDERRAYLAARESDS